MIKKTTEFTSDRRSSTGGQNVTRHTLDQTIQILRISTGGNASHIWVNTLVNFRKEENKWGQHVESHPRDLKKGVPVFPLGKFFLGIEWANDQRDGRRVPPRSA